MPAKIPPEPSKRITLPTHSEVIEFQGSGYHLGKQLGEGAFGRVFECWDEWGNDLVAKVFVPSGRSYIEVRDSWKLELNNLR
jgi:serine/threonine-protein kinase